MYRVVVEWPALGGQSIYDVDAEWVEVDLSGGGINYETGSEALYIPVENMYNTRIVVTNIAK